MTHFVLVHGAWHGSWCWSRVRTALRALGHSVFTPTLSGLGERSHLLSRETGLDTHVADIENLIRWEDLDQVVLVGHSYGGYVVRHVADRLPERLRHVVYLDAFVADHGRALVSYLPDGGEKSAARVAAHDGWSLPPFPGAALAADPANHALIDAKATPHPWRSFTTPASLTGRADTVASSYILAADNPAPHFAATAETVIARGWPCHRLRGGHDLMLDNPAELSHLLASFA